ncbi:hypothetical protein [Streptomyces sp. NPDC014746]|uniref:hypothetical protein n=1 Tax=Streptomyces sp. NPDC014746 TaxID=3364904 RepID=UPI0037001E82
MGDGPDSGAPAGRGRADAGGAAPTALDTSLAPDTSPAAVLVGTAPAPATGTRRLRFPLVRWVLAPRTTRQARRLAADFGAGMEAGTAWATARLARHPDEHGYGTAHGDDERRTVVPGAVRARRVLEIRWAVRARRVLEIPWAVRARRALEIR